MIDNKVKTDSDAPTQKQKQRQSKSKKIKTWAKIALLSILVFGFLGVSAGAGYAYYLIKDTPEFNPKAFSDLSSTTNVYDRNGNLLGSMQTDGNRELIKDLSEVSPFIVNAFIAAEDKTYYDHFGVNPIAVMRAVFQNFIGGGIVSGASTITQQTVKLVVFPAQEQTIQRKVQEMYLALQVNKYMTKEEVLVHYLNWIYFGKSGSSNLYGIQAAAKGIFGKSAKELNLAQASLLAAMVNNPSMYSPYTRLEKALEYQDYVLKEMLQAGKITESDYKEARAFDIKSSIIKPTINMTAYGKYPYVIQETEQRAAEELMTVAKFDTVDDAKQALFKGGYKVYTTVDVKLQDSVDSVLLNPKNYYPKPITYKAKDGSEVKDALQQAGAALIDNTSGAVLAFGGGRDFEQNQNNHATMPRQPGSTMKPIAVYGPAIDKKQVSPGSVIDDIPMPLANASAAGGKYFPMNHDQSFHGFVTVRDALKQSYNIPAIKTTQLITPTVGLDYVRKMGAAYLTKDDEHLVSGIGGLSKGLTVEEATSAYSAFPNSGIHHTSYLIQKIVDRNGKTIFERKTSEEKVFTPQTAYLVTDLLKDVVRGGTGSAVGGHFPGKAIAGKTGTTDNTADSWFVGYTPNITLGVWVGYDIPFPMENLDRRIDGSGLRSINIWNAIMDGVYANLPETNKSFPTMPGGIVQREFCTKSGMIPSDLCREAGTVATDLFVVGNEPKEVCNTMVKVKYVEINGKKYLWNEKTPLGGQVKEGIFFKREPYTLPFGNPKYKPKDADMELPKEFGQDDKDSPDLNAPGGLKVTSSSASSVSLAWDAVAGADGYVVLRSDSPAGPFASISDILETTTYTDRSVKPDSVYYYQVASIQDGKLQPSTGSVEASTGNTGRLPAPSGLRASSSPVGISVSWQPVSGAVEYFVYRSTDGVSFEKAAAVKGTSYQDAAADTNTWYKVSARNSSGESPLSSAVKVDSGSQPSQAPAAPSATITTVAPGTVKVSWKAVSGAVVYIVERSTGGAWEQMAETSGTSITDTTLRPNMTYSYRVRAVNAAGESSDPSNVVTEKR